MTRLRRQNTALGEIYAVWILFGLATIAVFETYWRFAAGALEGQPQRACGRGEPRLRVPQLLAGPGGDRRPADRRRPAGLRRARLLAYLSLVLCATVAIPGVQTPGDLDPKWSNSPAVIGVCLAVALTVWASLGGRPEAVRTRVAGDVARLGVGLVSLFFAAPYIAAELGFFLDGVPVLGWIFQTGRLRAEPGGGYIHAAVHHGHHHGLDGFLLTVTALLLSRLLGGIRSRGLRPLTAAYLALMVVYGLTNEAQDEWVEQVVKRGWTDWQIPDVLEPSPSLAWATMIACAAIVYVAFLRPRPLLARR